jgi:hypothetical protein
VGSAENRTAAYGLFRTEVRLDEVVTSLNSAGFESEDICVFLPPAHPIVEGVRNIKAAASAFEMEAGPEHLVSWLSRLGGVVISDLGCFVGSRKYLQALTRTSRLPNVAGNRGMLASLGIPQRYAARVRRDTSLVFVSCDDSAQSEWAREIMRRLRAEEVRLLGEFDQAESRLSS